MKIVSIVPVWPYIIWEKLSVTMINMSFYRARKIASIYNISFHIRLTQVKIIATIVILWNAQKWYTPQGYLVFEKFFLTQHKTN